MVLPPASMLPCLAMRSTGSSALAVRLCKASAAAAAVAHNAILRDVLTSSSRFVGFVDVSSRSLSRFGRRVHGLSGSARRQQRQRMAGDHELLVGRNDVEADAAVARGDRAVAG